MTPPQDVLATLYYLANDAVYERDKPYTLEYNSRLIPKSNIKGLPSLIYIAQCTTKITKMKTKFKAFTAKN